MYRIVNAELQPLTRLAILSSHPIQYYAPLFRKLATMLDVQVFFAHAASAEDQARAEFGQAFEWDVDLTSGYTNCFLTNSARNPGIHHFAGCDTPGLKKQFRELQISALLVMGWHLKFYLQGLWAAKRLGIPVLVRGDSHMDTPRSTWTRLAKTIAYPHFLQRFDAALYVGQRSRSYYEHYRYPPHRLFHSPHCVDTEWFAERATDEARQRLRARLGISPTTTLLLFAGKLVPRKRPHDLIAAARLLRSMGVSIEVLVAGEGELRVPLTENARASGVPVHWLGFCNQTEMPRVYAAADCLVLPSAIETWGLTANEALACGRPVIISEACGCSLDLAADGEGGRTFATGNIGALVRAIESLIASPPSHEAIVSLSGRHSLSAAASGVVSAVDYLIGSRGPRP